MADLRSVTIRLERDLFEKIERLSAMSGETLSQTIRTLLEEGLREKIYADNTELLADIVRKQMTAVMDEYTAQFNEFVDDALSSPSSPPKKKKKPARDYKISAYLRQCPDESGILHQ